MLQYVKIILTKVSFSKVLFEKELLKALRVLLEEEIHELKSWCFRQFREHEAILLRFFYYNIKR
jgi:hypothetical protein